MAAGGDRNHFKVLGVGRSADAGAIKRAFRKLARQHHPDVNPGDASAEARFKEISVAYTVLSDPDKRRRYEWSSDQCQKQAAREKAEAEAARKRAEAARKQAELRKAQEAQATGRRARGEAQRPCREGGQDPLSPG